ncbi:MAG: hypothetical protein KKH92_01075, partial [Firmicutes bacterium]|nr:hypothetical protein [Bacillota bacterium]
MEKLILFFKKGMTQIKIFFTHMSPKRITLTILVGLFVVMIGLSFFKKSHMNDFYDASDLINDYENTYLSQAFNSELYTEVVQRYNQDNLVETDEEKTILTGDMTGFRISKTHINYGQSVIDYEAQTGVDQDVFLLTSANPISFTNSSTTSGLYYLAIDYQEIENSINNAQIAITINGEIPFYESQTLVLPSKWVLNSTEFTIDRYQNEIQPSSTKIKDWNFHQINDYRGMHPGLFAFELEPGDVIQFNYVNAQLLIGQAYFVKETVIPSYEQYLEQYPNANVIQDSITVSAREMASRNDPSIRLRPEQDPSNLYYNTQFLRLNTIFGDSWQNSGQAVTYEIETEEAGFYHLSFKYRQYLIKDMQVFRKIKINGEIPFDSLEAYPFPYTTSFINRTLVDSSNEPLKIYLEAGTNTITLEAVNYPYRQTLETIQYVMSEIQGLSLDIKRYTSGGTDRYRDWDIEAYFPEASPSIIAWAELLEDSYEKLVKLSVVDEPSEVGNLKVAATRLKNIAKDI